MKTKILFLSDNPLGRTGLGRITGQIAGMLHETMSDKFDVAVAGIGGTTSRHSPFPIYPCELGTNHIPSHLAEIWNDFVGDERGIIFTVMNAGWLRWLAFPEHLPESPLKRLLVSRKMQRWCYVPVDSCAYPDGMVPLESEVLERVERVLAYTPFGSEVIRAAIGKDVPHLPHGTNSLVFYPRDRTIARKSEFAARILKQNGRISESTKLIGVIATNTPRKDWGLAFQTCKALLDKDLDLGLWAHTNGLNGAWDLRTLAYRSGMLNRVMFTMGDLSDEDIAWGYSACDVTMGIGSGEGWGMPLSESLACGVPVVTGNYAAAMDFVPAEFRVSPVEFRIEGQFCSMRPVYSPNSFAEVVERSFGVPTELREDLYWESCWKQWEEWFKEGIQ